MASEKNLKLKKDQVSEINAKLDKSNTVLLVDYQGMTVSELNGLRKSLKFLKKCNRQEISLLQGFQF